MSDKDFVVKNGLVVNNFLSVNATTIFVGNDSVSATVNTTIYTGTSNNTLYVGNVTAANVVSNAQLQANLANYTRLDGLQANIAKMHVNSALYLAPNTDIAGDDYIYTNYARYTQPGVFSNNITINGNVVFANVNQTTNQPNMMTVVGNATFQNSVTITGSYLNTSSNLVSFGTAFTVAANGNVGIGNTAPADMLIVGGNANVAGTLSVNGAVTLANTLSVTGNTTLTGGISVNSINVVTNSASFGTTAGIYSNGNIGVGNTTPADKISVTGNVAVSDTIKVGSATINATNYSGTAANAASLGGISATNYLTIAGSDSLLSSYFKKDVDTTVTANATFAANVKISSALVLDSSSYVVAAGSNGAAGQALISNGTGVYWGSVNTTVIVAPGDVNGNSQIIFNNNGTLAANAALRFNFSTNTVVIGNSSVNTTINSTAFSGTANNALSLGGNAASDYAKKADSINIGTTAVAINRSSGSLTLAGVTVDTANNATNLGGVAASGYQTAAGLSANVATLTANNTSFVGSVAAANVVSNAQLQANLSGYMLITGSTPASVTVANSSTSFNGISNAGVGVYGTSQSNFGVYGVSNTSVGVVGSSNSSAGVYGASQSNFGVDGASNTSMGIHGTSVSNVGGYFLSSTGTGLTAVSNSGIVAQFQNTATVFAGIYANGNMGIGTTTPGIKLEVRNNSATNTLGQIRASADLSAIDIVAFGSTASPYGMWGANQTGVFTITDLNLMTAGSGASIKFASGGNAERMRLAANGNLGIGNTTPGSALVVQGSATQASGFMSTLEVRGGGSGENGGQIRLFNSYSGATAPSKSLRVNNSGSFNIVNDAYNNVILTLDDTGNLTAANNVTAFSDARIKTNVQTIENALDKVSQMRGVMYERTDNGTKGTGVIAQEIQKVLPEVVVEGELLSVAYGNIVGVLIEAIKELKSEIEQLKAKQ